MKARYRYTPASLVRNTYECTQVDGFWTRTAWEEL